MPNNQNIGFGFMMSYSSILPFLPRVGGVLCFEAIFLSFGVPLRPTKCERSERYLQVSGEKYLQKILNLPRLLFIVELRICNVWTSFLQFVDTPSALFEIFL